MSTPKRFNDYTDTELLSISNEDLNDSLRIEAINRGIKPPVTLSEAILKSEWTGYQKPAGAIEVYVPKESFNVSPFGWLDKEKAMAALEGMVRVEQGGYSNPSVKIVTNIPELSTVLVGVSPGASKAVKFEEYFQDDSEFDKMVDECMGRLSRVRQDHYNKRVNAERKAEYLRLSRGDVDIAKGFWAKAERTEWPE